ncbi:MAG: hypothetical protein ACKO0Z_12485 [Betaproteobacteria bacterium]
MNQASPLVINVARIHQIEFRTRKYAQGFDETMRAVFPNASWYPRHQRWTLRVTDEDYADTRELLDAVFENFYPGEYPELAITIDVAKQVELAPLGKSFAPIQTPVPFGIWHRYVKPAGDSVGSIDV